MAGSNPVAPWCKKPRFHDTTTRAFLFYYRRGRPYSPSLRCPFCRANKHRPMVGHPPLKRTMRVQILLRLKPSSATRAPIFLAGAALQLIRGITEARCLTTLPRWSESSILRFYSAPQRANQLKLIHASRSTRESPSIFSAHSVVCTC